MAGISDPIILSHYQTSLLLALKAHWGQSVLVSPDLGLSTLEVRIGIEGVAFPSGQILDWPSVEQISASANSCFALTNAGMQKVASYSELTDRLYSLMPTAGAPTLLISGIPMHRIKDTEPQLDTLEKIKAISPLAGQVLDTATGLGYTAIAASQTAEHVTTIELDPAALEIARLNPWSRGLFDNPKITQLVGDSFDMIESFPDGYFNCVLHDPPAFALAGHLYSAEFYIQLHRVLQRHGRLFHYIGNPESKSGHNLTRGVIRRLQEVGFTRVKPAPRAFGVVATI